MALWSRLGYGDIMDMKALNRKEASEMPFCKELAETLLRACQTLKNRVILQNKSSTVNINPATLFNLSPKEKRIALALAHGETVKEIAFRGHISVNTVETHKRHIFKKTGVHRQTDLVRLLIEH